MSLLLVDFDSYCYKAAAATEKVKYLVQHLDCDDRCAGKVFDDTDHWKKADDMAEVKAFIKYQEDNRTSLKYPVIWSRKDLKPFDEAKQLLDIMLADTTSRYPDLKPRMFLTPSVGNFRDQIATRAKYKGNRTGLPPTHLKALREYAINDLGAIVAVGEEADDRIGCEATANPGSVVASLDKDLMMIPGKLFNPSTKEEFDISPKQALLTFYAQVLSGDTSDNVPGLTGYGPVKAKKALADCNGSAQCWERVLSLYYNEFTESHGERYALEAARLIWIRRQPGEIWSPPSSRSKAA